MGQSKLGRTMILRGEIEGDDDLVVLGTIEGPITISGRLCIEKRGLARGELVGRVVEVRGEVEGPIRASERIEIRAEAASVGDLFAPRIVIADGARFEGQVHMDRGLDDGEAEDF